MEYEEELVNLEHSSENVRTLADIIDRAYRANRYDSSTFNDCVDLWLHTLTRFSPGAEERYLETVGRMQPETAHIACEGFALLMSHFIMEGRYSDLLGPVYMELASRWKAKGLGQYFTPWNMCVCMARMAFADHDFDAKPRPSVNEPCVGSGAMLLAVRGVVAEERGRDAASRLRLSGQDIDTLCVSMTRVQLLLTNDNYMSNFLLASYGELCVAQSPEAEGAQP